MKSAYRHSVARGNAPDPTAGADPWAGLAEIDVGGTSEYIYITAWDNHLMLRMSYDGISFGPDIEFDYNDPPELYYFSAQKIQVRNKTAASIARYQVVFMW